MKWKKLKEFCNNLPETELEKEVILWREDEAVSQIKAMCLKEDHYVDPELSENGCFPETDAKSFIGYEESYPNGLSDLKKVYDKGHPILWEDF